MNGTEGIIFQLNASGGGVPKQPILQGEIQATGLSVDRQNNRRYHGGPDRALCLYAIELIQALNHEGHPIQPGDVGENITTRGLDWGLMVPGSRWRLGDKILIEITSYTVPCKTIATAFADGEFRRISQKLFPGWSRTYARIIHQGSIRPGDPIVYVAS